MRVVVCDDNIDAADTLALALRIHGHDVKAFYDGQACIDEAPSWGPSAAFLDIGMPQVDGYAVAKHLRTRLGADILLVAVTAWSSADAKKACFQAGFDLHIPKPAMVEELLLAIARQQRPNTRAS